MLGGKHHCLQAHGPVIFIILHSNLALSVGTKVRQCAVLAYLCKLSGELVGQADGIRHIFFRLVGRVAEHHALVSGADGVQLILAHAVLCALSGRFLLLRLQRLVNAHGDIGRLLVQNHHHTAGVGIKPIIGFGIADFAHRIADDLLDVHISIGGNFAHNHHQSGGGAGLTGHTAHGVFLHQRVQHRIGNRVTHFIGMSLCD